MTPLKKNPIAAQVQPLAGRQLQANWQSETNDFGGNFDRRNLSEMWKSPRWSSKIDSTTVQNIVGGARLSTASGI